jgi:hypothetical protein
MQVVVIPGMTGTFLPSGKLVWATGGVAMTPTKLREAELPPGADDWRHVWLTKASIDLCKPNREKIARYETMTKMSPARRLEKLRRLRATLEPPRSWLYKK